MSEDLIIALVGLAGIVLGAVIQQIGSAARNNLEAYRLAQRMQTDNSLLWQWNRELVDHIYKRFPPPPPAPPAGLFTDKHE